METDISREIVIRQIEKFIAVNKLYKHELEIGSRTEVILWALLRGGKINKRYQMFKCKRNDSNSIIKFFSDRGFQVSKFTKNYESYIFLLFTNQMNKI